jgi:hypothetical protein
VPCRCGRSGLTREQPWPFLDKQSRIQNTTNVSSNTRNIQLQNFNSKSSLFFLVCFPYRPAPADIRRNERQIAPGGRLVFRPLPLRVVASFLRPLPSRVVASF